MQRIESYIITTKVVIACDFQLLRLMISNFFSIDQRIQELQGLATTLGFAEIHL